MNTRAILSFVCDEVTRQGHNIDDHYDGWPRVLGLLDAWGRAYHEYIGLGREKLDLRMIKAWAALIEPTKNHRGWRQCQVTVGGRMCTDWKKVPEKMEEWIDRVKHGSWTPDDAYVQFEIIHPFEDGNGRTGKIIHNWLSGSLHDPILVADYFGGGNP